MFQRRRKLLSAWGGVGRKGGGLNNFLQAARCLGLVNCFKNIILIEIFEFNYFLAFRSSTNSWNFPGNLDFRGKIVANFLLRNHFLSIYNVIIKQQINHGPFNDIFHFINQSHTLSTLLYHLPCIVY